MKKVMVFGTFDGVHDGHRDFFRQAKALGDYLIAVVPPDHHVHAAKGRHPTSDFGSRVEELEREDHVDQVIAGDEEQGTWNVIRRWKPDVIAVGYDQDALRKELILEAELFPWHLEVVTLEPHHPEKYKSSILNRAKL